MRGGYRSEPNTLPPVAISAEIESPRTSPVDRAAQSSALASSSWSSARSRGQRRQDVVLDAPDRLLGTVEAAQPLIGDLDQVPAAVGRITTAEGELPGLEVVQQQDQVVGVDAQQLAESCWGIGLWSRSMASVANSFTRMPSSSSDVRR